MPRTRKMYTFISRMSKLPWLPTILLFLLVMFLCFMLTNSAFAQNGAYVVEDDQFIYAGNNNIELVFQRRDGELCSLVDKMAQVDFISEKSAWWSLYNFHHLEDGSPQYLGGWLAQSFDFSSQSTSDSVILNLSWGDFGWDTHLNFRVVISIKIDDDLPLTYWWISITNDEDITIRGIDFPAISGFGQISTDPRNDCLVYPSMSGLLFHDPLHNFQDNRGWGWQQYYPSGYATMQFMAYYSLERQSGLYLAAADGNGYSKFINVSKPNQDWLSFSISHVLTYSKGNDPEIPYPVVVGIFSGDWYDAAQIYRQWAVQQAWVSGGRLSERSDIPEWFKDIGIHQWISTYPLCYDLNHFSIVPEISQDTAQYMGFPVAMNWIGWEDEAWYINYPEVFPPKEGWSSFENTINEVHGLGNYILLLPDTTSFSSRLASWENAQQYAVVDDFGSLAAPFPFEMCEMITELVKMCPATDFWRDELSELLLMLAAANVDIIQLDGFPIFGPQPCTNESHDHAPGGGNWWYIAYEDIFSSIKSEARQSNPNFVFSSEGMAEPYISLIDSFSDPFITGWSPATSGYLDNSEVEIIPLWHAVYHDYSLIQSSISFFNQSAPSGAVGYGDYRDYYVRGFGLALVWGEVPTTWYADEKITELNNVKEQEMADYLKRVVQARSTYAKPFLVYGKMLKQPDIVVPTFLNAGAERIPYTLGDYPSFHSSSVLVSLWKASSDDVGYIFTNISHDPVTFELTIDPQQAELDPNLPYTIYIYRNGVYERVKLRAPLPISLSISTEPLDVLMIGVTEADVIPPVARFAYSPENPTLREDMVFDGSSSYDPNGDIVFLDWDFGDGNNASGKVVSYCYSKTGEYTVTLTVTDTGENAATIAKSITIGIKVDVNGDGTVDIHDLVLVCSYLGMDMDTPLNPNPDVNNDGKVDILDVVLVAKHFGETHSPATPSKNRWIIDTEYISMLEKAYNIMER